MKGIDMDELRRWIGRTETAEDVVTPGLAARFNATLGDFACAQGDAAPLAIHWCLAPPAVSAAGLGEDGHPERGGFLPPVALPRRMWAGGSLEFVAPIGIGDRVVRLSTIADVAAKSGRSGELVFVTLRHEISTAAGVAVRERQDLVYREAPAPGAPAADAGPAAEMPAAGHCETLVPDTVMLFRYSALTFNGHRIHFDLDYARGEEGYAGLVVHGPLQATLLLHLAARLNGSRSPARFDYRALSPVFHGSPLRICANKTRDGLALFTCDERGKKAMQAEAAFLQ